MNRLITDPINIVPYLLKRKIITLESVFKRDLKIKEASSLNKNLLVFVKNKGYVIKQSRVSSDYQMDFLKNEAKFYMLQNKSKSPLKKIMPKFVGFDRKNSVLIIQYIKNAIPLDQIQDVQIPYQVFEEIGKLMSNYHNYFSSTNSFLSFLPVISPVTLFIIRPRPDILTVMNQANFEFLRKIQNQTDVMDFVIDIPEIWKNQTVIHGDIKLENILVTNNVLKIIDWELVDKGDPCWDVACILCSIILNEYYSNPTRYKTMNTVDILLKKTQPQVRFFWSGYCCDKQVDVDFKLRCAKYLVGKLLQSAYDSLQDSEKITHDANYLLKLCKHITVSESQRRRYLKI